jgi:cyclophilin family peptidyl-prolyl cis-trans isomerase
VRGYVFLAVVSALVALAAPAEAARVRFAMNVGIVVDEAQVNEFVVETFDDRPITSANFLAYVSAGRYDGMFFHRLVPAFVLQGGGFHPDLSVESIGGVPSYVNRADPVDLDGNPATPNPTIVNEFANPPPRLNLAGTLAMAKLSGDPDSASSQFFFNTVDNPDLDTQNGGFTVFAEIVEGLELVQALSSVSRYNLNPDDHTFNGLGQLLVFGVPDGIRDPGAFGSVPAVIDGGLIPFQVVSAEIEAAPAPMLPPWALAPFALMLLGSRALYSRHTARESE